jgi:hypothetical protein
MPGANGQAALLLPRHRITEITYITVYMALSAAELDVLIADLTNQYGQLSREYSETVDEERKEDITDQMDAIDYQLARLEEQRQTVSNVRVRAAGAG